MAILGGVADEEVVRVPAPGGEARQGGIRLDLGVDQDVPAGTVRQQQLLIKGCGMLMLTMDGKPT